MKNKNQPNQEVPSLTNKQFNKYVNFWDIFMSMSWKTPRATKVDTIVENELEVCAHLDDADINFIYCKICFLKWCIEMEHDEDNVFAFLEWCDTL
jgi:hypothetical protein